MVSLLRDGVMVARLVLVQVVQVRVLVPQQTARVLPGFILIIMKNVDLAIIGGGPSGLMASFLGEELGLKTLIIEKKRLGSKILISGNGRCNFTNETFKLKDLVSNYENGKFLYRSFSEFGPKETINFFTEKGIKIKRENSKIFPASDRAEDVFNILKEGMGNVIRGEAVKFNSQGGKLTSVSVNFENRTKKIEAKNFLLSAGGRSYPHLGSDGSGFYLAKDLGHKVVQPMPGLTPVKCDDHRIADLQGISLNNVKVSAGNRSERGDLIFTHFGLSGPAILNLSLKTPKKIDKVKINIFPNLNNKEIDQKLQNIFKQNRNLKNCLSVLFPERLVKVVFSDFNLKKRGNKVTRAERKKILRNIVNLSFFDCELLGFRHALVTRGGVDLREISNKSMRSKKYSNLFFAGEIIDVVGKTGGFNMQHCWSSGRLAANSVVRLKN